VQTTSESEQHNGVHLREWGVIAFILVGAAIARGHGLTDGGLTLDEGYSLIQSERSLLDIFLLNRFAANPPFYLATLHVWRAIFSELEFAGKSLSMLAGVLGVFGVWLAARERFGPAAGVAASLIVAANAFHIHHSQEIRGYSLLFAAVAFADYFSVRWDDRGGLRALLLWSIASWFAVNIHHFAWYFVALQVAGVMLWRGEAERRKPMFIALGCVVLASSPMLASFVIHLTVHQSQNWIPLRPFDNLIVILGALGGRPPVAWGGLGYDAARGDCVRARESIDSPARVLAEASDPTRCCTVLCSSPASTPATGSSLDQLPRTLSDAALPLLPDRSASARGVGRRWCRESAISLCVGGSRDRLSMGLESALRAAP
jgi:thiamine transporter ThiT